MTPSTSTPALSMPSLERAISREKMSRMRLRIAERLKESQNIAASLTTFQEVDMSGYLAFRARRFGCESTRGEIDLGRNEWRHLYSVQWW